jgi:hypothetical protein
LLARLNDVNVGDASGNLGLITISGMPAHSSLGSKGSRCRIFIDISSLDDAYAVLSGMALSTKVFNLGLGFGYGRYFMPTLGVVRSQRGPTPSVGMKNLP